MPVLLRLCSLASLLFTLAVPAAQQPDADGSKDHPLVPRMPGFYINNFETHDFNAYAFLVGDDNEQRIEGKFWQIQYIAKEGAKVPSPLEVSRNYRNAFTAKGGKQRYTTSESEHTTLTLTTPGGGELWCDVAVSNGGEVYELTIVEKAAMNQQVQLTAEALAKALNEQGQIALHNILFDTGKATLKPESSRELQLVIDVLKADAALKLEIQGHTDNTGAKAANQTLSQQRADAVRDYLVKTGGIAAARLTAVGYGDTKPVAPNTTDDGKAQNRRVQLVKK
jgi:outer membrane protein OmpA-like peptidoglycan-associated protein